MDSLYNPYFVIPLTTWFVAQLSKFVQKAWRGEVNFKLLYNSGGMPSAHSAVVTSLAVTALIVDGAQSPLFGISVVLAAIVMYDSFGVRRSTGDQARAINAIIENLGVTNESQLPLRLREIFGHKPSEVIVGAAVGVATTLAMTTSAWVERAEFLALRPTNIEAYVYMAVFLVLIIAGLVGHKLLSRKPYRHTDLSKSLRKLIFWLLQLPAWIGILFAVLQKESVPIWAWRLWPLLILLVLLVVHSTLAGLWYRYLPGRLQEQANQVKRRSQANKRARRKKKHK